MEGREVILEMYGKWKYILTEWAVYNKIGKALAA